MIKYLLMRYRYLTLGVLFLLFVTGIYSKYMKGSMFGMYVNVVCAFVVLGLIAATYISDSKKKR